MPKDIFPKELIDKLQPYNTLMPEIIEKAREIKSDCKDYIIYKLRDAKLQINTMTDEICFEELLNGIMRFTTTWTSIRQLCGKLEIPYGSFYIKLQNSKKAKQKKQVILKNLVENLADLSDKRVLIRTYKNTVRAFLSTRYSIFDSDQISPLIDTCFKTYMDTDKLLIGTYINTPEQLHIRIIDKRPVYYSDQNVYTGLTINSSDIGTNTLSVNFYVYETTDSNGICIEQKLGTEDKLLAQRHLFLRPDEMEEKIVNAIKEFPKITEKIKDYIRNATACSLAQSGLYSTKSYNGRMIIKTLGLTDTEAEKFIETVKRKPHDLWNYITAITDFAKTIKDQDRRTALEKIAGKILLNPQNFGIRKEEY